KDIKENDINEFYYTKENINYDAYYLRYLFYVKDGKHIFFFEERERKGDYGPTSEADVKAKAEFELSDDEWSEFISIINGGEVKAREENIETGGSGPWTYLYWSGDKDKYQEYSFESYGARVGFESFCEELAEKGSPVKQGENELSRLNAKAREAFEEFFQTQFSTVSFVEASFVTKRNDNGYYSTEYPVELFHFGDHFMYDFNGDGRDEMIIIQLSGEDVYEKLWLSGYVYDDTTGKVEDRGLYEYGENILESDDGNTFVFLYKFNNKPAIGIFTMESSYTRGDGMTVAFKALSFEGNGLSEFGSAEFSGNDLDGAAAVVKTMKNCGVPVELTDFVEDDMEKLRENVVYACDGILLAEIITKANRVEYDADGYTPQNIYRHVKALGYSERM
nr:hypothetical protein [Lachnospiraceae bacterium]